jgi:DNA-directed RNA polymerase delta subunit
MSTNETVVLHGVKNIFKVLGISKYYKKTNPESSFEFIVEKTIEQHIEHKTPIELNFSDLANYIQPYLEKEKNKGGSDVQIFNDSNNFDDILF